MQPITTKRLVLRRFRPEDAPSMRDVLCHLEVMRFSLNGPMPADDVAPWVAAQIEATASNRGLGRRAVVEGATGQVIGFVGLGDGPAPREPGDAELAYRLALPHWGRGLATEAAGALTRHGLAALGVARVIALVDPGNTGSVRVLQKIGMAFVRPVKLDGYDHADHLYAISAVDPSGCATSASARRSRPGG